MGGSIPLYKRFTTLCASKKIATYNQKRHLTYCETTQATHLFLFCFIFDELDSLLNPVNSATYLTNLHIRRMPKKPFSSE